MAYAVEFQRCERWLRVRLSGASRDLASTIDAWRRIADEVRRDPPPALLVISAVEGEPLSMAQIEAFLAAMPGLGLEAIRVAYVYPRTSGWVEVETAQILAMESGFEVHAFSDERIAQVWLLHGER